jgi:hypothetical protein
MGGLGAALLNRSAHEVQVVPAPPDGGQTCGWGQTCHAPRHPPSASSPMYVERCPRLERVGRGLFEGEEAVLHVMGSLAGPWPSTRAPCASRRPAGGRVGGRSRIVRKVRLSALVASPRDPASRDESCRVRRLYCRTVTEEDL